MKAFIFCFAFTLIAWPVFADTNSEVMESSRKNLDAQGKLINKLGTPFDPYLEGSTSVNAKTLRRQNRAASRRLRKSKKHRP